MLTRKLTFKSVRHVHHFNRRKIAILGWYGDFNVGNDAVLLGILSSLKNVMHNTDFVTFSWHPNLTTRKYGVKALSYHKLFQTIPKVDALIVGGGTLLTDWQLALLPFIFLVSAVYWAKALGKKIMFYAVGAEPFYTRLGRFLTRKIVNKADIITVRGYRSKKALEMLGVTKPIHVKADPALTLQPVNEERAEEILKHEGIDNGEEPRVVICLRRWRVIGEKKSANLKVVMADVCDYLVEKFRAEVILLPMSTSVYDDDRKVAIEIIRMMKNHGRVKLITGRYTPQEVMAVVERSNLVVSMRLHPLIFAVKTQTPMIALVGIVSPFVPPSTNKISEFLESVNQESPIHDYENVKTVDLLSEIEAFMTTSHVGNYSKNAHN